MSCGEENLLCLEGDPYFKENILIHEFAHAVHRMGLSKVDPTFDGRLKTAYEAAMAAGLWNGTYSTTNKEEYWAEGVLAYFDAVGQEAAPNDAPHPIITREALKDYDPELYALVNETMAYDGHVDWRYGR